MYIDIPVKRIMWLLYDKVLALLQQVEKFGGVNITFIKTNGIYRHFP